MLRLGVGPSWPATPNENYDKPSENAVPARIAWSCNQRDITTDVAASFCFQDGQKGDRQAGRTYGAHPGFHMHVRCLQSILDLGDPTDTGVSMITFAFFITLCTCCISGLALQSDFERSQSALKGWMAIVKPGLLTICNILLNQARSLPMTTQCQMVMFPVCMAVAMLIPRALEAFLDTLNAISGPKHRVETACVRCDAVMFPVCIAVAILFPSALEAFRDTLRLEHYKAATRAIRALEADEGLARLQAAPEVAKQLDLQAAPEVAKQLDLQLGATVTDATVKLHEDFLECNVSPGK
ncbi:hypothetical protein COCOBI_03-0760 [Coccomyxa sp. Obi]|nr:hypothetical protein COCOBI_03-0760 [Coccomyxa sp. Obi]